MPLTMKAMCLGVMLVSVSCHQIRDVKRHRRYLQPGDACTCLSWRDSFTNYSMSCDLGEEFCVGFFMHLSGNVCVNQGIGEGYMAQQVCFVSPACQELNGGRQISTSISTKICTEADERLVDKTP